MHVVAQKVPAQTTGQLHVLVIYGHPLRVDGGPVDVFKEGDQVRLCALVQSVDGCYLEAEITIRPVKSKIYS